MYIIKNGKIILKDRIIEGYNLVIQDELISDICPADQADPYENADLEVIDAKGGFVTPGLIDIHSDYIEHMAAPRPTALMDFSLAIHEAERELISHGITTMYHSLSLYKINLANVKPIRKSENVQKFIDLIEKSHTSKHLIHHRFHARFEIDNVAGVDSLRRFINEGKVDLLSFMDHSPGQGQYRNLEKYKQMLKAYGSVSDEEELDSLIKKRQEREKISIDELKQIARMASDKGIPLASHDDDTIEKLEIVKDFGTTISEFPVTLEVAKKAKEMGLFTVAGAPNILLGGSHSGNLGAAEAISHNCIDILCSDYYPSGLLHAVFKLHNDYGYALADMFRLVTINPARAVRIDHEVGSIEQGKKADLLIINELDDSFPVVTYAFVEGKLLFKTAYRGYKGESDKNC